MQLVPSIASPSRPWATPDCLLTPRPPRPAPVRRCAANRFFSGFLIRFEDIPVWWKWYSYINPLRYAWTGRESWQRSRGLPLAPRPPCLSADWRAFGSLSARACSS
jgi:hypothetical protein